MKIQHSYQNGTALMRSSSFNMQTMLFLILLFGTVWFSSDGFVLELENKTNIYFHSAVTVMDILVIVFTALVFIKKRIFLKGSSLRFHPINKYLLLLFPLFLYGFCVSAYYAGKLPVEDLHKDRYVLYSVLLCVAAANLGVDRVQFGNILEFFLFASFLKGVWGLFNYFFLAGSSFLNLGRVVYAYGDILFNLLMAFSFSLSLLLDSEHFIERMKYLVYCVTISLVILLSMRRIAIGGLLIILGIVFAFAKSGKKLGILLSMCVLLAALYGVSHFSSLSDSKFNIDNLMLRIYSINLFANIETDNEMTTDNGHFDDILDAWDNVKEAPVSGKGLYTEVKRYRVKWQNHKTFFHNAYLSVWVGMGIFGVIFYIRFLYLLGRFSLAQIKQGFHKPYFVSFLSVAAMLAVNGVVDGPFYYQPSRAVSFFLILGLMIALSEYRGVAE